MQKTAETVYKTVQEPGIKNRILGNLQRPEKEKLLNHLESLSLNFGQILYSCDEDARYVYFPETSVVSLLSMMENGNSVGVAIVGNEGMIGIRALSGLQWLPYHAIVHSEGTAYRIKAAILRETLLGHTNLQFLLLNYIQGILTQITQLAACNQLHSVEQKLIRWILMMQDRTASDTILLTHDMIASIIGARRAGVSEAAASLQKLGAIVCRRGKITVLDRQALETTACECYRVVKQVFDSLTD